jgi:hypothetical protein
MFVRWKIRKSTDTGGRYFRRRGQATHYAVLVESVRIEGKPRQRFVAHLARIAEGKQEIHDRADFWRAAISGLDKLGINGPARERAEAKLAEKVRRPTDEETAELRRQHIEFNAQIFGGIERIPKTVLDAGY